PSSALARKNRGRPHFRSTPLGILKVGLGVFEEALTCLPLILQLRRRHRSRPKPAQAAVAILGDNLDEINGIAISSRVLVGRLREMGVTVYLVGVAFHGKRPRLEAPGVLMAPGR